MKLQVLRLSLDKQVHKVTRRDTSAVKIGESIVESLNQEVTTEAVEALLEELSGGVSTTPTPNEGEELEDEENSVTTTVGYDLINFANDYENVITDDPQDDNAELVTTTETSLYDEYDYYDGLTTPTTENYLLTTDAERWGLSSSVPGSLLVPG